VLTIAPPPVSRLDRKIHGPRGQATGKMDPRLRGDDRLLLT
jgi:hypothetical protein